MPRTSTPSRPRLLSRSVTAPGREVRLAEEVGDEGGARQLVEVGRRAHLLDPAVVHHRHGVGHRHGLLLVVRDVHEREADLRLDALELELHLAAQLEVERAERLVEQQQRGPVHQRPGQRDPLLLAAGELRGLAVGEVAELDQVEAVGDPAGDVVGARALEPERHVLPHGEVREQRVALEHRVDRALVRPRARHVPAADRHGAGGRLLEAGHHPQRRRLAAAGRAEQGEERPRRDREREVVHRDERAELLGHALDLERGTTGSRRGVGRRARHAPITVRNSPL